VRDDVPGAGVLVQPATDRAILSGTAVDSLPQEKCVSCGRELLAEVVDQALHVH
jgi:hypothetical protein